MCDRKESEVLVLENFVGGDFVPNGNLKLIDSHEPATGRIWARIPDSGEEEVAKAVEAARTAFTKWSSYTAQMRAKFLYKIANILEERIEEFAVAESRDTGKPLALARSMDIPRAVFNFRHFASAIQTYVTSAHVGDLVGVLSYVHSSPVGVAGIISPWNLPLYLLTFKIAPAIAAGCTVVAKPSEMTSVTAWMLCKVFQDAGLPHGVVNMVFGYGGKVGEGIVKHPGVPVISFTGSTAIGQRIAQITGPFCKKLSMELGGKNAAIIFEDADLDAAVAGSVRSSFTNQGQVCLCTSRIFVQRKIYDTFILKFADATRRFKVGDPADLSSSMGALISKQHRDKVVSYIHLAQSEGGEILTGGPEPPEDLPDNVQEGFFVPPTIITSVSDVSPCMQEEIFGPVTCVVPFDTEEEVIERANNIRYGLCAVVWTKDVSRTHRLAQRLEVGTVWTNCWLIRNLNMPFGGTKLSGIGREGGKESLDFYTESRTVCIKLD